MRLVVVVAACVNTKISANGSLPLDLRIGNLPDGLDQGRCHFGDNLPASNVVKRHPGPNCNLAVSHEGLQVGEVAEGDENFSIELPTLKIRYQVCSPGYGHCFTGVFGECRGCFGDGVGAQVPKRWQSYHSEPSRR
jgi:hypothetical protein